MLGRRNIAEFRIAARTLLAMFGLTLTALAAQGPATGWESKDVGAVKLPGQAAAADGQIVGAGADIWGAADSFHYLHTKWEGDIEAVVRISSMEKTHPWAKAGIMLRRSVEDVSPHIMLAVTPEKGVALIRREMFGGQSQDDAHQAMRMVGTTAKSTFQQRGAAGADTAKDSIAAATLPRWLKLVKRGNVVAAFDSPDGREWLWAGTVRQDFGTQFHVGLAVTSHDHARGCRVLFSDLQVGRPANGNGGKPLAGEGDGLQGRYFPNGTQTGSPVLRVDPAIDFDWGRSSPLAGIPARNFSARWDGELQAQYTEPYALHVVSDDRARVWLDGALIIDEWYEHAESVSSAVVNLEAGKRYPIRVDFFQNRGRSMVKLLWSSPSTPRQVVSQSQLYTDATTPLNTLEAAYQAALAPRQVALQGTGIPEGWQAADIGQVGVPGRAEFANAQWKLSGSGADIWANADGFHYLHQIRRGDFQFVARVLKQDATEPWAKSGLMVRQGLAAEARHFMLAVTPGNGAILLERPAAGGNTTVDLLGSAKPPVWLKVIRKDTVIAAYTSADGLNWNWAGSASAGFAEEVQAGLAVCSHDNSDSAESTFDQVTLDSLPPSESPLPAKSSGTGLLATYHDSTTGKIVNRIDPTVDFDWDTGSPAPEISPDLFSVRWEGVVQAEYTEPYALHIISDDGARLWLDGELLIDAWSDRGVSEASIARRALNAGQRYSLRLECYDRTGEAIARLLWSSPSTSRQPIPTSQLYPAVVTPEPTQGQVTSSAVTLSGVLESLGETATILPTNKITGVFGVSETPGYATVGRLGPWGIIGDAVCSAGRRGYVEYDLTIPAAGVYVVQVEGTSRNKSDLDPVFYLVLSVDGESLGRKALNAGFGKSGAVTAVLPWLEPGTHRVRVYWDNARLGRSIAIQRIRLLSLQGPDNDQDGVLDWVKDHLKTACGLESPAASASSPALIRSATSPACVEGRGGFLSMMGLQAAGQQLTSQAAPGNRWYVNIPLSSDAPADLQVSYQNGGLKESAWLVWEPTDLLKATDITVRVGDALLLRCGEDSASSEPDATSTIEINGVLVHHGKAATAVAYHFNTAGEFVVKGAYFNPQGGSASKTITVRAVSADLGPDLIAWVGKSRSWDCPAFSSPVVLDADSRLTLSAVEVSGTSRRFPLMTDEAEPRFIAARVGQNGPILDVLKVDGFRLFSGLETDYHIVQTYPDGTDLIEMGLVASPLPQPLAVEIKLIVGGVVFEDGTVLNTWTAPDFNPLGEAVVHFLRPAMARTAACHSLSAWQGPVFLGDAR